MQPLTIGVNESTSDIICTIENEINQKTNRRLDCSIYEVDTGNFNSIVCKINDDELGEKAAFRMYDFLKVHVSNALADYIVNQYEEKLVMRIVNSNYCYFTVQEKKLISDIALKNTRNEDKSFLNSLFQIRRRNMIVRKLLIYFENANDIILDGFVNFRLKEYIKDLEEVVDKAVDNFLMEREYMEFIKLLKYFVDIQEPKFDSINVIMDFDNRYVLMDESGQEITNECIREFVNEIAEGDVNYDDLLVSSLITLAPKKISLHGTGNFKNKELLETIKNVFGTRVEICAGCDKCIFCLVKTRGNN